MIANLDPQWIAVFSGIFAAAFWGAGDFIGGYSTRRLHVYQVILISQLAGLAFLIVLAMVWAEPFGSARDLVYGSAAGLAGVFGLIALYRGMAEYPMGLIAPLSAVLTAIVPIVVGLFLEGVPSGLQAAGMALALLSVWLISSGDRHAGLKGLDGSKTFPRLIRYAGLAGLGFGLFFVLLDRVSTGSVFWPVIFVRVASATLIGLLILLGWRKGRGPGRIDYRFWMPLLVLGGFFDAGGNVFFAWATQLGRLDLSAVVSSLYPAGTVFLAWVILKEQLSRSQLAGVAAALVSVGLIAS